MVATTYFAKSPSMNKDAILKDSDIVEHAPYNPKKGIFKSLAAYPDEVI